MSRKIENGMLRLNRDKVQLPEFLDQLVDMFRLQATRQGPELPLPAPAGPAAHVHTDQKRLRQILINLLSNAIKYTERGSVTLTVRYRSEIAEFEIADTGRASPRRTSSASSSRSSAAAARRCARLPGTGLGLTITKLLTQIMGGEVLVQQQLAAGHSVRGAPAARRDARIDSRAAARRAQRICDYSGPRQQHPAGRR